MSKPLRLYVQQRESLAPHGLRPCRQCHEVKVIELFPKEPKGNRGRGSRCNQCVALRARQRAHSAETCSYTGRLESGAKRWRRKGKRVYPVSAARLIQHLKGKLNHDPLRCFYTGAVLQTTDPSDPSTFLNLDHVIPATVPRACHSINNLVPCSAEFNQHKGNQRAVIAVLTAPEHLRSCLSYSPADKTMFPLEDGISTRAIATEWVATESDNPPPQMGYCEFLRTFCTTKDTPDNDKSNM